jgi:manganese/zinc/iron transport system permease protein
MAALLENVSFHAWIILAGSLCAASAALLGNFLVLRRMSLMADAISHAVLPGLAAAFFISGSRHSLPMFLGAAVVGVLTALFTEWIRTAGKVDEGASMGVVFTALFAVGLIMIVQAADHVDLDPGCVLYGAIEATPLILVRGVPQAVVVLGIVLVINLLCVIAFYKELTISAFDPELATTLGINARAMHYLLMTLVAITAVASFESVGNILVVAMFVVPAATAHLLTDRLRPMIVVSLVVAVASAAMGHGLAIWAPGWFGYKSTNTAGMMAVAAGLFLSLAVLFAPRHGLVSRGWQRFRLSLAIALEDVLVTLARAHENKEAPRVLDGLGNRGFVFWLAHLKLEWSGRIRRTGAGYELTEAGLRDGVSMLRSHRLWETYLDRHFDLPLDHTHEAAERIEHYIGPSLQDRLSSDLAEPRVDPQGRTIPMSKN